MSPKALLVLTVLAITNVYSAEPAQTEWVGEVSCETMDPKTMKFIRDPHLRVKYGVNLLLVGKALIPREEAKKNRGYVVKGVLSPDGKTIQVTEMSPRTEYVGIVVVGRPTEKIKEKFLILHCNGRGWKLRGELPDFAKIKPNQKWKVEGLEEDSSNWIAVKSMTPLE